MRFSFGPLGSSDEIFRNLRQLKLNLTRSESGRLTLLYELHGCIGDLFDGDDDEGHTDGVLLDAGTDAVAMAEQLIEVMRKGGAA